MDIPDMTWHDPTDARWKTFPHPLRMTPWTWSIRSFSKSRGGRSESFASPFSCIAPPYGVDRRSVERLSHPSSVGPWASLWNVGSEAPHPRCSFMSCSCSLEMQQLMIPITTFVSRMVHSISHSPRQKTQTLCTAHWTSWNYTWSGTDERKPPRRLFSSPFTTIHYPV